MRKLSFATFLHRTLGELSFDGKTGPYRLAEEAEANPRLVQPLCLYLALTYSEAQQSRLLGKFCILQKEFDTWDFLSLSGAELERELELLQDVNNEYRRLWCSYVSVRDRKDAEDSMKVMLHKRVRELQAEKGVSNYRIYTDLNLNPGNLNAWLSNQDCSKVSLRTARKTLAYLEHYPDWGQGLGLSDNEKN